MPGIEAKARQSVDIFGQRLVGSGHYLQLPHTTSPLLRLDLKMQVGDGVITLQQIADGNAFWIRRDQPDGESSLSRMSVCGVCAKLPMQITCRPRRHSGWPWEDYPT